MQLSTPEDGKSTMCRIVAHLSASACFEALQVLIQEARAKDLLPTRTDIFGEEHHLSDTELIQMVNKGQALDQILKPTGPSNDDFDNYQASSWKAERCLTAFLNNSINGESPKKLQSLVARQTLFPLMKHQKTVRGHVRATYNVVCDDVGKFVITGSDDGMVKIWHCSSGVLAMSCLGHEAWVNDLACSKHRQLVASCSDDNQIICWSLAEESLGQRLWSYTHAREFGNIQFCPRASNILLACDEHGDTCLFDIEAQTMPESVEPVKFLPGESNCLSLPQTEPSASCLNHYREEIAGVEHLTRFLPFRNLPFQVQGGLGLADCQFSPNGERVVGISSSGRIFLWACTYGDRTNMRGLEANEVKECCEQTVPASYSIREQDVSRPNLKMRSVQSVKGHESRIKCLQWSPDGQFFATSDEKVVKVWAVSHEENVADSDALQNCQELTNYFVSLQIAWTKDSSQVLVSTDNSLIYVVSHRHSHPIRASDMPMLSGHSAIVHTLDGHPTLFNLVMSASYDGTLRIWDISTQSSIFVFDTAKARPFKFPWPGQIPILDGKWTPCGTKIVLTDSAGQLHFFEIGETDNFDRTRYDQFMKGEGAVLGRFPEWGWEHLPSLQPLIAQDEQLCDCMLSEYPEVYQKAWQKRTLRGLSVNDAQSNTSGLSDLLNEPRSSKDHPALVTSAVWAMTVDGEDRVRQEVRNTRQSIRDNDLKLDLAEKAKSRVLDQTVHPLPVHSQNAEPGASADRSHGSSYALPDLAPLEDIFEGLENEVVVPRTSQTRAQRAEQRERLREERLQRQRQGRSRRAANVSQPSRPNGRRRRPNPRYNSDNSDLSPDSASDHVDNLPDETLLGDLDNEYDDDDDDDLSISDISDQENVGRAEGPPRILRFSPSRNEHHSPNENEVPKDNSGRPLEAYAWLQVTKHIPGVYIPQVGDEVVYMREGHKIFMAAICLNEPSPWPLDEAPQLRPAEPCTVKSIDYIIGSDLDGVYHDQNTYARVELQFERSTLSDHFYIDLPPSHLGHAEFLVLRSCWSTAVRASLKVGSRVKERFAYQACHFCPFRKTFLPIFYPEEADGGTWWNGSIIKDSLQDQGNALDDAQDKADDERAEEDEFLEGIWERFTVSWDEQNGNKEEPSAHGVWELFQIDATESQILSENPTLSDAQLAALTERVEVMMSEDRFNLFVQAPEPAECFPSRQGGNPLFYNNVVELPMALDIIGSRLQNGYYRNVKAVANDANLIKSNAKRFNGAQSRIGRDANETAGLITGLLSGDQGTKDGDKGDRTENPNDGNSEVEALKLGDSIEPEDAGPSRPVTRKRRRQALDLTDDFDDFGDLETESELPRRSTRVSHLPSLRQRQEPLTDEGSRQLSRMRTRRHPLLHENPIASSSRPNLRPPPAPRLRIRLRSSGRQKTSATDVPQQDDIDTHQERLSEPDFDPEAEIPRLRRRISRQKTKDSDTDEDIDEDEVLPEPSTRRSSRLQKPPEHLDRNEQRRSTRLMGHRKHIRDLEGLEEDSIIDRSI